MLEWNVYYGNFNSREIETYNVFHHYGFVEKCRQELKNYKDDREGFLKEVRSWLMYFFWSKCEWEVIIQHWPNSEGFHDKKIDVYDQVTMNWNKFADYLWENRKELRKKPK